MALIGFYVTREYTFIAISIDYQYKSMFYNHKKVTKH